MQTRRAELGVSEQHETALLDGVQIAYEERGAGPPVVCLHAAGHGGRDFELFRDRVADRFRVITVDWPGQGRSGEDEHPASGARYAQLLGLLVEHLDLETSIFLGNSIGGETALRFAAQHPERVRAVVACDPGGLAPVDRTARIFCRLMTAFFRAGSREARWFRPAFSAYYKSVLPGASARPQRDRIVAPGYEIAPVLEQCWRSFSQPEADIRPLIDQVTCPVLFAWAKSDNVVSWGRSKQAVDRFRNAQVLFFAGGHAPFLEDPDAFAEAFCGFVQGLPSSQEPSYVSGIQRINA